MSRTGVIHAWHLYWLLWASFSFITFIVPEIYAVSTDWRRTLSASVWSLEDMVPGQAINRWTVTHYWFISIYGVLVLWLFFHFGMGWWRGRHGTV